MSDSHIAQLVQDAERELRQNEFVSNTGPYVELCSLANRTDLNGRITIAKLVLLLDAQEVRLSRAFDNCFENFDGAEVRAALEAMPQLKDKIVGVFA